MSNTFLEKIVEDILNASDARLTNDQEDALQAFWDLLHSTLDRRTLLLTGSAGTGKTFMINLFTKILKKSGYKVILLAPTGRAAKVISRRTKSAAFTIHHHIYNVAEDGFGDVYFRLKNNKEKSKTVYIVDEASMIGMDKDAGKASNVLKDLLSYVFDEGEERILFLVGDPVQLPPVGLNNSPALDPYEIGKWELLDLYNAKLSEVKRQHADSGVLENAVLIRDAYMESEGVVPQLQPNREVQILDSPYEAIEAYTGYFQEGNPDRVIFITYSNFRATKVNQALRYQLWQTNEPLVESELIMVVKNNYAWGDDKVLPFIANGEMGTIRYIDKDSMEERYGLHWVDVEIEFQTTKGDPVLISCKVVLDLLENKQAQLSYEQLYKVTNARRAEYENLSNSQSKKMMRQDPYVNALQIKYGYAITGHKSQGGQWEYVIIGFEPDYGNDFKSYMRWSYTVFTRAESQVFMLNCPFVDQ